MESPAHRSHKIELTMDMVRRLGEGFNISADLLISRVAAIDSSAAPYEVSGDRPGNSSREFCENQCCFVVLSGANYNGRHAVSD